MGPLAGVRGVLFDFGNTLIPFGRRESEAFRNGLAAFLAAEFPAASGEPRAALDAAFEHLRRARTRTLEETDPADAIREACRELGGPATAGDTARVARGLEAYRRAFLATVVPGPGMTETLDGVRRAGLKCGLVSNFSLAAGIHDALALLGIRDRFDVVVVSGDEGLVKPHPEIFARAARRIGLPAAEVLFVGDKLHADVAGAAGAGMRTARITEHLAGSYDWDREEEAAAADAAPDLTCDRLTDLLAHLPRPDRAT